MKSEAPELARRKMNRKSTFRSGRTIGEKREKLKKASERAAEHKKNERKKHFRFGLTVVIFAAAVVAVAMLLVPVLNQDDSVADPTTDYSTTVVMPYIPTIEVIDEDTGNGVDEISSRMKEYIGEAEADFRELGYVPTKAVIPSGAVREIDFYLEGYSGYIKMIMDRGTGVSVEDADRMIRYLAGIEVTDFAYIDVRVEGKAYWK